MSVGNFVMYFVHFVLELFKSALIVSFMLALTWLSVLHCCPVNMYRVFPLPWYRESRCHTQQRPGSWFVPVLCLPQGPWANSLFLAATHLQLECVLDWKKVDGSRRYHWTSWQIRNLFIHLNNSFYDIGQFPKISSAELYWQYQYICMF